METKSRYEVISNLEDKKRELIQERDSLGDELVSQEKVLKDIIRQKEDNIMVLDRKIEDQEEAFLEALKAICTRLTSGWFREFAIENYYEIIFTQINFVKKFRYYFKIGKI